MRSRRDEPELSLRVECMDGEHDDCPHMLSKEYGVNPFRLRSESRVRLCTCRCHAGCPVTRPRGTVPVAVWRESCTCRAAANASSTVGRVRDFHQDTAHRWLSEARVAALNAAGAQGAGQSGEQVNELYRAELRARGLEIPPDAVLDVEVSLITGDSPGGTGLTERALLGLVKRLYRIGRAPR